MRVYIKREGRQGEDTKVPPTDYCHLWEDTYYTFSHPRALPTKRKYAGSEWYTDVDDLDSFLEGLRSHEGDISIEHEKGYDFITVTLKGE